MQQRSARNISLQIVANIKIVIDKMRVFLREGSHLSGLLVGVGLIMIAISVTHALLKQRALSLSQKVVQEYTQQVVRKPTPTHIFIKWFVDVDIEEQAYQNDTWVTSADKASHLMQSANPGENGNIIIYGHNLRTVLGNIRALKGYKTITVTTSDGEEHLYTIKIAKEVSPKQTSFLEPTDTETLTLYTCSGLMDAQRFIVQAVPLEKEEKKAEK